MKNSIYHYLRNRSIYSRVHRFNLVIAITSLLMIAVVSIALYTSISMIHLSENEGQSLYYYSKNIENELFNIDGEFIQFTQTPENQEIIIRYLIMSDFERYVSSQSLTKNISRLLSVSNSVLDAFMFTNNFIPIHVFNGRQSDFSLDSLDYETFLKMTIPQPNKTVLMDAGDYIAGNSGVTSDGLLYAKRITDHENESINAGYLLAYISKSTLFDFNSGLSPRIKEHAQHHIINQNGSVIFSSDPQVEGTNLSDLIGAIREESAKGGNYFYAGNLYPRNQFSMCAFSYINVFNCYVVTTIPYSFFASELLLVAFLLVVFTVILSLTSAFMSRHIAQSISIPINGLLNSLRAVSASDFTLADTDYHNDELAVLRNLLNDTTERIEALLQQVKAAEKQKFSLQLKALQAQINPHFLINTLNTAIWLSDLQGADNIKELMSSLVIIMNNILKSDTSLISVREEVNLLEKYITIQKFRYFGRFDVSIRVDESTASSQILKFVLQPIVENCLMHGLSENTAMIHIAIHVFRRLDKIHISVNDDGVGMPTQRIRDVLSDQVVSSKKESGLPSIGLSNIQSRIKLFYGPSYGIKIKSEPGKGTKVKITFPFLNKEAAE